MKAFLGIIRRIANILNSLAEFFLVCMVFLTVADVIFRVIGATPILGTYELVGVMGGLVIAFAVPKTSWERGHVFVDILIEGRSDTVKNIFYVITRIMGIVIMFLVGWNLIDKGWFLQKTGQVSPTLRMPYYPWVYAFGVCFFVESITLLTDIFRIFDSGEQK
jgi:TRAP-type C4-dicarboxylate transport system permease small subunit